MAQTIILAVVGTLAGCLAGSIEGCYRALKCGKKDVDAPKQSVVPCLDASTQEPITPVHNDDSTPTAPASTLGRDQPSTSLSTSHQKNAVSVTPISSVHLGLPDEPESKIGISVAVRKELEKNQRSVWKKAAENPVLHPEFEAWMVKEHVENGVELSHECKALIESLPVQVQWFAVLITVNVPNNLSCDNLSEVLQSAVQTILAETLGLPGISSRAKLLAELSARGSAADSSPNPNHDKPSHQKLKAWMDPSEAAMAGLLPEDEQEAQKKAAKKKSKPNKKKTGKENKAKASSSSGDAGSSGSISPQLVTLEVPAPRPSKSPADPPKIASLETACPSQSPSRPTMDARHLLEQLICPVTKKVFVDPVIAADGFTYERSAIEDWISQKHSTSPMTNEPLGHTNLLPNKTVQQAVKSLT